MSYSNSDVAHRWANGIGYYQGSNMHADEISIYSYSTVIAQCLDRKKKLFVVIDETLSPTTSKLRNYVMRSIPDSATIFYTHIKCYGNYDHVQFLSQWKGKEFDKGKRLEMITQCERCKLGQHRSTCGIAVFHGCSRQAFFPRAFLEDVRTQDASNAWQLPLCRD